MAIVQFVEKENVIDRKIDRSRFRELLIENLKTEGYEEMYLEFLNYEKIKATFK